MAQPRDQWDIASSIGQTALLIASARAVEADRSNALVRDVFAGAFVAAAGPSTPLPTGADLTATGADEEYWSVLVDYVALRTRHLDEFAERSAAGQLVVLAAGLDSRAYRLVLPETRVFEVDQPRVLQFKQRVLDELGAVPGCERVPVGVDLRDDWVGALREHGFDPSQPTAWLAEGLLLYLSPQAETRLLHGIEELSAPGSVLAVETMGSHVQDVLVDDPRMEQAPEEYGFSFGEMVNLEPREDFRARLGDAGWHTWFDGMDQLQRHYGRDFDDLHAFVSDMGVIRARRD